jgi:hypothetical protein
VGTQCQVSSRDGLEPPEHDLMPQVPHALPRVWSFSRCHASPPRYMPLRQRMTGRNTIPTSGHPLRQSLVSRKIDQTLLVIVNAHRKFRKHTNTVIAFTRKYSRVSYLSIGKQWLKKLIIHHHASTNLIYQLD